MSRTIIGLKEKTALQPVVKDNKVLTFNGEIYNYKEIKEDIKNKWTFTTSSDTEVILALYYLYKEECINYLDGMFSFVIWNIETNELFCARDRIGIKPFYYYCKYQIFKRKGHFPIFPCFGIMIDIDIFHYFVKSTMGWMWFISEKSYYP